MSTKKIIKILVWRAGLLGDTLVAVPALKAIRKFFPNSEVTLLWQKTNSSEHVNPQQILEGTGLVDYFFCHELSSSFVLRIRNVLKLWRTIRREKPDIGIILEAPYWSSNRRDKFLKWCGISKIISPLNASPLLARDRIRKDQSGKLIPMMHIGDQLLAVLEYGGLEIDEKSNAILPIPAGISKKIDDLYSKSELDGATVIGVGLWSNMPSKRWPIENYIKVLESLYARHGVVPIFLGGSHESEIAEAVRQKIGVGYNFAGELTVQEGIAALKRAKFYMGNDTGVMHMAVSAGIPCIALFSATNAPGLWEPHGDGHSVFRKEVECAGCLLRECIEFQNKCLKMITVEEVVSAAEGMLKTSQAVNVTGHRST